MLQRGGELDLDVAMVPAMSCSISLLLRMLLPRSRKAKKDGPEHHDKHCHTILAATPAFCCTRGSMLVAA